MTVAHQKIEEVVTRLVPRAITDVYEVKPNRCILACRVGYLALKHFGVESTPQPVGFIGGNKSWVEWISRNAPAPMPPDVYSVAIDTQSRGDRSNFPGHLVLYTADSMLDLDMRQFARPQHQLLVPDSIVVPRKAFRDGRVGFSFQSGVTIYYQEITNPSWKGAPDWIRNQTEAVQRCIALAEKEL